MLARTQQDAPGSHRPQLLVWLRLPPQWFSSWPGKVPLLNDAQIGLGPIDWPGTLPSPISQFICSCSPGSHSLFWVRVQLW